MGQTFRPPVNKKQAAAKASGRTKPRPSLLPKERPIADGRRFGFLTVIGPGKPKLGQSTYRCRCDCGVEIVARRTMLRSGNVRSCGSTDHRRKKPPRLDGYRSEVDAARAFLARQEQEKAAAIYPKDRTPPPRDSDLALWKDRWME